MAYGQQTAYRTQTTIINVIPGSWTALQPTASNPSIEGATSVLPNRFAIKVFNVGTAGAARVGLSYTTLANIKTSSHWLGAGQFRVEPAATGLTLYGRAKVPSGVNSIRCVVVEYGH